MAKLSAAGLTATPDPEGVDALKVAVTLVAALRVAVHDPVPEQPPPLHPENAEPVAGVADNVTALPEAKLAVQLEPKSSRERERLVEFVSARLRDEGAARRSLP